VRNQVNAGCGPENHKGELDMIHLVRGLLCVLACSALAAPAAAQDNAAARSCSAKLTGLYGFHCHGSAFNGVAVGPVTFVGTVEGKANDVFDGRGTLTSSAGSILTHFAGPATYGPNCFGHIDYTANDVILPDGTVVARLPPASFDFIGVDGGNEILGAAVAPRGVTGDVVPRLGCRLDKVN
jgi:hypothetical protein